MKNEKKESSFGSFEVWDLRFFVVGITWNIGNKLSQKSHFSFGVMTDVSAHSTEDVQKDSLDDILKLSSIREDAKSDLQEILESTRGRKVLVCDIEIAGLLSQILPDNKKFLDSNGVYAMIELRQNAMQSMIDTHREIPENVIYLVRPHLPNMKIIAEQITYLARSGIKSLTL